MRKYRPDRRCVTARFTPAHEACLLGNCLLVRLPILKPVAYVSDRKLITRTQSTYFDALAVDPNAVGTAEVPDHDLAAFLSHAAVVSRNPQGIQASIAVWVPSHHDHGAIQHDVWPLIDRHQSNGHGETSSIEARRGPTIILSQA
jgi:hypothetical protein